MRILDRSSVLLSLEDLALKRLRQENMTNLIECFMESLVSGPTGSVKQRRYAALSKITWTSTSSW